MVHALDLKTLIRDVPDFPKPGIVFKDITTLLKSPKHFKESVDQFADYYQNKDFDVIIGPEARGFVFGATLAYRLDKAFIPVRKKGKLPAKTRDITYELEYGCDTLSIHEDAISSGTKAVVVDDLLATGGTVAAIAKLVEGLGGHIAGMGFLIELVFLQGRDKLSSYDIYSQIQYDC